ncbi:hypothetical protein DER44DRAFT_853046 [Fusarium oxysporum]|nr:hypothetical protein DER44DRAFT_853046 [Fusarium oxysporum]
MAEIVTVATDQTGPALHVRHEARAPEFDKAYWTAQHAADNDLYGQYNASDVGHIVVGSTAFPARTDGTRHIRIIYDKVTQHTNRTGTTGETPVSSSHWTIWMSIVYHYSVYQSTDKVALNTYCAQFPNSWQPVLAHLEPSNRPHPGPVGGGSGGNHIQMLDFTRGDASSGLQSLEEWIAKTEQMKTALGLSDDSTEGGVTQKEKLAGAESSKQY